MALEHSAGGAPLAAGEVLAAIDIGTNSVHLVVARALANHRFEVLSSEKEMVRLGHGSGEMKHLEPDAIDRGVAALRRLRQVADISGATVRAVATSAVREAENQSTFLRRAREEAGVEVEVITGTEEARLIHLGVLQALPLYGRRVLLVDIGGGSTELLVGHGPQVEWARSLKLGAIRLTDGFFPGGRTSAKRADRCRRYLHSFLAPTAREIRDQGFELAVGSSGTISNLAVMAAALRGDPPLRTVNSTRFTRSELDKVTQLLLDASTAEERSRLPGIEPRRADILPAGALLLDVICAELDIDTVTVSAYALREGVLLDTLRQRWGGAPTDPLHHLTDLRRESVEHVLHLFDPDSDHAHRCAELALELFDQTRALHGLDDHHADLLEAAALLANIGRFVSHSAHHKHSYYLIRNTDQLTGFTSHEIELIAQIARYHRKSAPKPRAHAEFSALSTEDQRAVRVLAGLLRIAIGLDRGHGGVVRGLRCRLDLAAGVMHIDALVEDPSDAELERYTADARKGLAEEALGVRIDVATVTA